MAKNEHDLSPILENQIGRFEDRLKSAMNGESVLSLANRSNLSEGSLRNMLKGGMPRLDNLILLSQALGKSVQWLATGEDSGSDHAAAVLGDASAEENRDERFKSWKDDFSSAKEAVDQSFGDAGLHIEPHWHEMIAAIAEKRGLDRQDIDDIASMVRSEAEISSEFALIPGYRVEVSAGPGSAIHEEKPTRYLAFRHKWLRYRQLKAENLALVFARGDSMEPTIHDNNTVMIDTSKTELVDGSIYVIRTDNHLVVKRVQKLINKGVLLLSDNKEYKEQMLEPDEAHDLAVIGKVVWIGKDV